MEKTNVTEIKVKHMGGRAGKGTAMERPLPERHPDEPG